MKPSVIVWDLETVPDLAGFAAANDLVGKSDADSALGNKFPKHIYHTALAPVALTLSSAGNVGLHDLPCDPGSKEQKTDKKRETPEEPDRAAVLPDWPHG
jgi:hypothetical protein